MKLKKIFAWALVLAMMMFVFAGCGETTPSESNSSKPTTTTTDNGASSTTTTTEGGSSTTTTTEGGSSSSSSSSSTSATTTTTTPTTKPTQPQGSASANVVKQGAKGDGKTDDTQAFINAMNAVNNNGKIYIPAGNYAIKTALTVPKTVTLVFERGAVLEAASKVTVTVNGWIDAPEQLIFSGAGTYAGTPQSEGCPQWFGAKGDGNVDDTAAFQKTVDMFSYVRVPYRAGKYVIAGTVTISKPIKIIGDGTSKVGMGVTSTNKPGHKAFVICSSNVEIRNFKIDGSQATKNNNPSTVFYFDCSSANLSDITIADVWSGWTASLITDSKTAGKSITNVLFKNITANYCYYAPGIHMTNFTKDITIDTVLVNQVSMHATMVDSALWIIENCQGMKGEHLDVAGGYSFNNIIGYNGDGLVFKNCSNIVIDRFMADYINGFCTKMINCTNMRLINWVCSLYEDGALYMENCTDNVFEILKLNGIRGGEPLSTHPGTTVVMKNSNNNKFYNTILQNNLADGMLLENCTGNYFENILFTWNDGYGYKETGSSNNNVIVGGGFYSNSDVAITQVGSGSKCIGVVVGTTYYKEKVGSFTAN